MHALGNDFVVLNTMDSPLEVEPSWVRQIADRNRGIGFDQLLVLRSTSNEEVNASVQVINSDGSEAEQCGNGVLCVSRYLFEQELSTNSTVLLETGAGVVYSEVIYSAPDTFTVRAELGAPSSSKMLESFSYQDAVGGIKDKPVEINLVSMGNPHVVVFNLSSFDEEAESLASAIQQHELFPNSTNVEFVEVIDQSHLRIRVFERGAGETQACGTGACASVVAARTQGLVDERVTVIQQGGEAIVEFQNVGDTVSLTALAVRVFEGEIEIEC